ncbi:MAG TPA: hypothetical protein VGI73_12855 [Solirubrobacterales bacterium]
MQKFKIVALDLVVIGALSAITAGAAFAEYHVASASGGSITGSQVTKNEFATDVGTVKCSVATFSGSQSTETASTLTVHPAYSGCSLSGLAVTVSTSSCSYRFDKPVTEPVGVLASFTVLCSTGSISITESLGKGCVVSVGAQGPLGGISFASEPGGHVTVTFKVTGTTYTDNGKCPSTFAGHTSSTGTYSGTVVMSGSSEIMVT